jgi:hypothetical protein
MVQSREIGEAFARAVPTSINEEVEHDSHQPGTCVGPGLKFLEIAQGSLEGVLDQVPSSRLGVLELTRSLQETTMRSTNDLIEAA